MVRKASTPASPLLPLDEIFSAKESAYAEDDDTNALASARPTHLDQTISISSENKGEEVS